MPYVECPGCGLELYSAAAHSWNADSCPVCDTSLRGAARTFSGQAGFRALRREFAATPGAVSRARHALDGLAGELGPEMHEKLVLLVSELVTNSVKHSKATNGAIELVVYVSPELVHAEVTDEGNGFERPLRLTHDVDAEAGRGLELMRRVANRWGKPVGPRTRVWFEIDRTAAVSGGALE
jgi:anti-sigma regulatory factor (Ser/Thr protein kinase)